MSKEAKLVRGQVRIVVQELLPEMVNKELQNAMYKQLSGELTAKLKVIEGQMLDALKAMDSRAKDVQSFIMREMVAQTQPNQEAVDAAQLELPVGGAENV